MVTRLLLSALFLSFFSTNPLFSQTVAVGHIHAEVVDAVSASSFASTDFTLVNTNSSNPGSAFQLAMISEKVSLGTIQINSGEGIACNLTLQPVKVTDENGNDFSMEPTASCNGLQDSLHIKGSQTIELAGKAILASNQASGLYQGSYTLVFAYN
jgi:hypothetical protein